LNLMNSITSAVGSMASMAIRTHERTHESTAATVNAPPREACKTDDCMVVTMRPAAQELPPSGW
jgi:hypothetical protein